MQQSLEVDSDVRERRENLLNGIKKEDEKAKRRKVMFTHGFRKFFETTTVKNGLPILYAKMLMSQSTGLEDSYYKPQIEDLLEGNEMMPGYLSVIDNLTINEVNKLR